MRAIVLDLKTGDVFNVTLGWNRVRASVFPAEMWCKVLFEHKILNKDCHKNRSIISVRLPCEQEEYT